MKKHLCLSLLTTAAVLLLSSCGDSSNATPDKLRFVTGGESGTYYAFGSVLAQHATNEAHVPVVSLASNGSQANVLALEDQTTELAFCQSDVMAYAYNGTNTFKGIGKIDCFSVLGALYPEQVQIVTINPNILSVSDLRGKIVSIGAAGSGVYFNSLDILKAYDLTINDIKPTYQSFGDSANDLRDGKIDAAFIVAGAPTNAIIDLSTTCPVRLIPLDRPYIEKLIASSPYYSADIIDKANYNLQQDVPCVSVAAVVLVRNTVPAASVYQLCADIFDNAANLTEHHAKYKEISLHYGASMKSVPYHPGAARYFKEKGFDVPVKEK